MIQIPIIWLPLTSTTATIYNPMAASILKKVTILKIVPEYWKGTKSNIWPQIAWLKFFWYLTPSESQEKPSAHEASWLGWLKAQWVLLYGSEWMIYRYWYTFDMLVELKTCSSINGTHVHTILNHKDLTGSTVRVREGQKMAQNCLHIAPYCSVF